MGTKGRGRRKEVHLTGRRGARGGDNGGGGVTVPTKTGHGLGGAGGQKKWSEKTNYHERREERDGGRGVSVDF